MENKINNTNVKNTWIDYKIDMNKNTFGQYFLEQYIIFFNNIIENLSEGQILVILFKIQGQGIARSLTDSKRIIIKENERIIFRNEKTRFNLEGNIWLDLFSLFFTSLDVRGELYLGTEITNLIFSYKVYNPDVVIEDPITKEIITGDKILNSDLKSEEQINLENTDKDHFKFSGYNLPKTMDFTTWGDCEISSDYKSAKVIKKSKKSYSDIIFEIKINDFSIEVEHKIGSLINFNFTDSLILNEEKNIQSKDLNNFKRIIKNNEYFFDNDKILLLKTLRKNRFIEPLEQTYFRSEKFATYDIETINNNGVLSPYCICIYDGKNLKSFYLTDFKNVEDMIRSSINFLLTPHYSGYKIYIHNFSNFDGVFMLKELCKTKGWIRPIIRDDHLIEFKISFNCKEKDIIKNNGKVNKIKYKYNISFRDSLLLLPDSLKKLSETYNLENKGIFPYNFVNQDINLDYEGKCPDYKYFDKISEQEYEEYSKNFINKNWNLKDETIKYCLLDVKILYDVIDRFSFDIFSNFNVDIDKTPTFSSLAFRIYRSNFYDIVYKEGNKIPSITGRIYEDLRKSFTGGAVDVYKPHGKNLFVYDVNSLYPFIMKTCPMPVGVPTYFNGDILSSEIFYNKKTKPFGFFKVEVEAPENLHEPLLQLKRKVSNSIRTLAPVGKWTSWYFSEELYNAQKYGYKFKVLQGYLFDSAYIFQEYVDRLYKMRIENPKGSPLNKLAKLLLNSLFGRFGMIPENIISLVVNNFEGKNYDLSNNLIIKDKIDFKNGIELITYKGVKPKIIDEENNNHKNVSISIAAAITAYARIHMSKFKNNSKIGTLYYSDTDSLILDKKLPSDLIGMELGKLKLEREFTEAIFIGSKLYFGMVKNKDNSESLYSVARGGKNVEKYFNFNDLKNLLIKDEFLKFTQENWFREKNNSSIIIKPHPFTLAVTSDKRDNIYNDENKFIDTKPKKIIED